MSTPATPRVERLIAALSPSWALKRSRDRAHLDALTQVRRYTGAGKGRRFDGWRTPSSSANAAIEGALHRLRNRSRDLVRNNPFANRAVAVIESNTVGTGIIPQAIGGTDRERERAEEVWREWAATTACDADGILDFYSMQALFLRTVVESGECLVRARWRRSREVGDGLPIPLQLEVLEPDYLADEQTGGALERNRLLNGIEFDNRGRRVAYHLHKHHPGDIFQGLRLDTLRVPAALLIHGFRRDRPGQHRGVPWGASAILRLLELDRFEDAQLLRQEIASCFAAIRTSLDPDAKVPEGGWPDRIEPGMILDIGPSESVTLTNPPGPQNYAEFTRQVLLSIAAGYGVSYEALVGDLQGVNFSSGRMGWIEMHRNIKQWQRKLVIGQFCNQVWSWFQQALVLRGEISAPLGATWTPPRREMIDPTKEVPALREAVRSGFLPLSDAIRESGRDPEEVFQQIARDNETIDGLGLMLDSDPRRELSISTSANQKKDEEEGKDSD